MSPELPHPNPGSPPTEVSREVAFVSLSTIRTSVDQALLEPDAHVLPTLESDGSRRWLNPALAQGYFWNRRRIAAYALIAFFVTLPHLRFSGKPVVLIDIIHRQFTFLGHTFYPTDSPLLALMMLMAFLSIMFVTATAGRVWCGWGCPQTVYLEFLFRPIDRLFSVARGGRSKKAVSLLNQTLRIGVYVVCSMFLAHTFLSYFVGTEQLAKWIFSSPFQHPIAFAVMGVATGGMLFDFLFFREQFCMIACPYGRFQSVMLDRRSWIVSYDQRRGEPRGKSTASTRAEGDCVDCGRCVAVCPTGIDIRKGLQLECIHCAQCIDACDSVMTKLGRPMGLVRYTSQDALEGRTSRWLRPRTIIYPILMTIALSLFVLILSTKFSFDAKVLPVPGAPFTAFQQDGGTTIKNQMRLRLINRSSVTETYSVEVRNPNGVSVVWSQGEAPTLQPNASVLLPIELTFLSPLISQTGNCKAELVIRNLAGSERTIPIRLVGPR